MKKTNIFWSKYAHFHQQRTKIAQINGGNDSDMQKLTGYGQNVFQKNYSTDLPLNALHVSSGHLDKDACSTMA